MEYVSLKKYDDILKKIEDEHLKRSELEKQIQVIDDRIIATGLTLKKNLVKDKIFKVFVKVFDSIFNIYDKLSDRALHSEIETLSSQSRSKFYLIEVYISKPFQEKVIHNNWLINATVRNSINCVSKSVNLNKKTLNPVRLIVPFENSIEPASIQVYLTCPGNQMWPLFKIANFSIDISYHFNLYSDMKVRNSYHSKVINLSKLYNPQLISSKLPIVKCKLVCSTDFQNFLQTLLKNSYHNWDPRKESCFSKSEYTAYAKTTTGLGNIISIELDTSNSSLTIHANPFEVFHLKKYFLTEFKQETYEIRKEIDKHVKVIFD